MTAHLDLLSRSSRLTYRFLQITAHSTLVMVMTELGVMAGRVGAISHCFTFMLRGDWKVQLVLAICAMVRLLAQALRCGPMQILLGRLLEHWVLILDSCRCGQKHTFVETIAIFGCGWWPKRFLLTWQSAFGYLLLLKVLMLSLCHINRRCSWTRLMQWELLGWNDIRLAHREV